MIGRIYSSQIKEITGMEQLTVDYARLWYTLYPPGKTLSCIFNFYV